MEKLDVESCSKCGNFTISRRVHKSRTLVMHGAYYDGYFVHASAGFGAEPADNGVFLAVPSSGYCHGPGCKKMFFLMPEDAKQLAAELLANCGEKE